MSLPLLLSFRKAAALLGVGRNNTLQRLIASGSLRPVLIDGRRYIPREQLETLAREGEAPIAAAPTSENAPKRGKRKGGSIADLKIV